MSLSKIKNIYIPIVDFFSDIFDSVGETYINASYNIFTNRSYFFEIFLHFFAIFLGIVGLLLLLMIKKPNKYLKTVIIILLVIGVFTAFKISIFTFFEVGFLDSFNDLPELIFSWGMLIYSAVIICFIINKQFQKK